MSDKEAILKIKNGEIDYYSFIVRKYSQKIYLFINKKIFDKFEVDDLTQNTFIKFYKALNRFDENRPVLPYLFQIAGNEIKMYLRSRKEATPLGYNLYLVDDRPPDNNVSLQYQSRLKQLSKEQKQVMELLTSGFSYQEIADKINKPINTIKSVIRRTRLKLIKKYGKT